MFYKKRSRVAHLPRWQALSTHVSFVVSALSGVLYFFSHELQMKALPVENHKILMVHGVAAYLLMVCVGGLMPNHIRAGWTHKRNIVLGSMMVIVMGLLMVSGLLLYYADEWRDAALWIHWLIGGLLVLIFPLHFILGRRANYLALKH